MTEERFVAQCGPRWAELAALLERAGTAGASSLAGAEVRRLGALYRATTTDLATARSLGFSEATVRHVNRLCARAHDLVYAGRTRGRGLARLGELFARGFPEAVRRTWRFHAFAAAAAIVPGVIAFFLMRDDPDLVERTFGTVFQERAERAAATPEASRRYLGESVDLWAPLTSWGLMSNNVRVALICFALGATAGVGTLVFLAFNGVMLGAGFAAFAREGVADVLWTFIAPHGPFELTAIFLASGAGVRLGLSLLVAERRPRAAVFKETALESVRLLLGVAALLVVAGVLEAFVSTSELPPPAKWAVGAVCLAFLAWYFAAAGRRPTDGRAAHPA